MSPTQPASERPVLLPEPVAWNLINPSGHVVATEKTSVHAWARIGGFKPTLEGVLGFNDAGWRVQPSADQLRTAVLSDRETQAAELERAREVLRVALEALTFAQQGRECPSATRQALTAIRALGVQG